MPCAGLRKAFPQGHSCGLKACADLEEVGTGRQHERGVREGSGRSAVAAEMAGLGEAREGTSMEKGEQMLKRQWGRSGGL